MLRIYLRYYLNENKIYFVQCLLIFLFFYYDYDYIVYDLLTEWPTGIEYLNDFTYINSTASFGFNLYFLKSGPIEALIFINLENFIINIEISSP